VEGDDMAREPEAIAELRRSLGAQLATFRLAAELTQGQLAKPAICDRTTLVHIEKGRARADERFWRAVDAACDAGGALIAAFLEMEAAKAEHEQRERERRLASVRTKAAALRSRHDPAAGQDQGGRAQPVDMPELGGLRRALLGHQAELERPPSSTRTAGSATQLAAGVEEAHRLYQRADYDGAARLLPLVISRIESTDTTVPNHTKAAAYHAAAKLATKVGDSSLAWVAADRSLRLAAESNRHGLIGIANYQVACALLGSGHLADAEQTAVRGVEHIARHAKSVESRVEDNISARGALLLLLAITAARRGDAQTAKKYLHEATRLAERLGQDGNWLWTAFGPHQYSVGQGDDSLAVLHLLEAERVAKQAVSRNATARTLLATLLARERKSATPGLRALADRAGVA
jgi:DNA-binding XRE family transcriptional regulator